MRPAGLAAKAEDTRMPGSSAPVEKKTFVEEHAAEKRNEAKSGAGRDTIMGLYDDAPDSDDAMMAEQDRLSNPDDLYTPVGERHRRVRGFEDLLRKNRVDITARCGSCSEKKDRAA
jgi:hypothetical protein